MSSSRLICLNNKSPAIIFLFLSGLYIHTTPLCRRKKKIHA